MEEDEKFGEKTLEGLCLFELTAVSKQAIKRLVQSRTREDIFAVIGQQFSDGTDNHKPRGVGYASSSKRVALRRKKSKQIKNVLVYEFPRQASRDKEEEMSAVGKFEERYLGDRKKDPVVRQKIPHQSLVVTYEMVEHVTDYMLLQEYKKVVGGDLKKKIEQLQIALVKGTTDYDTLEMWLSNTRDLGDLIDTIQLQILAILKPTLSSSSFDHLERYRICALGGGDLEQAIEKQFLTSLQEKTLLLTEQNILLLTDDLARHIPIINEDITVAFFDYFTWLDAQITNTEQEKNV